MIKTAEELEAQAILKNITFWPVHTCSLCDYQCGYTFSAEWAFYDNGCYCLMKEPEPRSWADVAYTYNLNQPENNPNIKDSFLIELNKTWQFEPQLETA